MFPCCYSMDLGVTNKDVEKRALLWSKFLTSGKKPDQATLPLASSCCSSSRLRCRLFTSQSVNVPLGSVRCTVCHWSGSDPEGFSSATLEPLHSGFLPDSCKLWSDSAVILHFTHGCSVLALPPRWWNSLLVIKNQHVLYGGSCSNAANYFKSHWKNRI